MKNLISPSLLNAAKIDAELLYVGKRADLHTLKEFSIALHSYAVGYEFDANYTLPKSKKEG